MSTEPPPNWTFETLRMYLERIVADADRRYNERDDTRQESLVTAMTAAEKAVNAALAAAEKAVTKAELAAEKRFDATNEFRGQLSDQAATFIPRVEAQLQLDSLANAIQRMERVQATGGGRGQGLKDGWGYIVGAAGVISTIVVILLNLPK